jgi:putative ABC transport system permease protein
MNSAPDLSVASVIMSVLLLAVPLLIVVYAKIGVAKNLIVSALRMSIQLFLIGFFLEYLFRFNLWYVNLLWLIVMIGAAMFSVIKNSGLSMSVFALPVFGAFLIANISVVLYFNFFIASIPEILDAKFVIAIGGMILGNSLRANIVGLGDFYQELRRNEGTL